MHNELIQTTCHTIDFSTTMETKHNWMWTNTTGNGKRIIKTRKLNKRINSVIHSFVYINFAEYRFNKLLWALSLWVLYFTHRIAFDWKLIEVAKIHQHSFLAYSRLCNTFESILFATIIQFWEPNLWYRCSTFLLTRITFALRIFRWTNLDIIIITSQFARLICCISATVFLGFRIIFPFRFTLWAGFTLQWRNKTMRQFYFILFSFECIRIEFPFLTFDSFVSSSFEWSSLLGELNATLLLDSFERLRVEWWLLLFEFKSIKDWDRLLGFKLLRLKHFWLNSWNFTFNMFNFPSYYAPA